MVLFSRRAHRSSAAKARRRRQARRFGALERLEPRLVLASVPGWVDSLFARTTPNTVVIGAELFNGAEVYETKAANLFGNAAQWQIFTDLPEGVTVRKWVEAKNPAWVDVTAFPQTFPLRDFTKNLALRAVKNSNTIQVIVDPVVFQGDVPALFKSLGSVRTLPVADKSPPAVEDLAIVSEGSGELAVGWNPPASGAVQNYTARVVRGSGSLTYLTTSMETLLGNLPSDPWSVLTVTATNAAGTGVETVVSSSVVATDMSARLPGFAYLSDTGFSNRDNLTSDRTPTLTGRVLGNAQHVQLVLDGAPGDLVPVVDGAWRYTVPASAPLGDGEHSIFARPVGESGEAGSSSQTLTFVVSTERPKAPAFGLTADSDTGAKGDGRTLLETVAIQGVTDPGVLVKVSINGVPVAVAKSDANSGAWQCPLPRLFTGDFDITAVATSPAGVASAPATLTLRIDGVRTVMLDAAIGQPIELTAYHILGNRAQGFVVTNVHGGVVEKWSVAANAWMPVPSEAMAISFAAVQAPDSSRTVGFAERVRWIPSADPQGMRAAFDVLPLDIQGGARAPLPEVNTVPGRLVDPTIAYPSDAGATITWADPVDGCGCESTRYSIQVTQADGRTAIYSVPSTVHALSIADAGKVRTAAFWGATATGAGGRTISSAKRELQLNNRFDFSVLSQLSAIGVNQLSRIQLAASPTPVEGQQNSFVLGQTYADLAYLEVRAVPDADEAAQGLEAGTFPVVSFDSNKLTSGQIDGLSQNPILAQAMFPGTIDGDVQPDQVRVHFQAGESLEIAGNVDASVRDRATIVVEEAPVLAGNSLGIWLPMARIPVGADGAYSYLHEVKYGMSSVRVRLELTAGESGIGTMSQAAPVAFSSQTSATQNSIVSTPIDLSYNAFGITTEGWSVPDHQGFDGSGHYYNSDYTGDGTDSPYTGESLGYNGLQFPIGPIPTKGDQVANRAENSDTVNAYNYVQANGQTIAVDVPAATEGFESVLYLTGAAKNGDQLSQQIVLEFSDGSTETWTQSFTDWANNGDSKPPSPYPGEHLIKTQPERIKQTGALEEPAVYVFAYGFKIGDKELTSIRLPNNTDIGILSAIVATAPRVAETRVESFILGHINLTGVDVLTLTVINETNIGAGGASANVYLADQPQAATEAAAGSPTYGSKSLFVPMGQQRTVTYVGTNSYSAVAFAMQKASNVVGPVASTYIPDWTFGSSSDHEKYAANIDPSLNNRITSGQHWTMTFQNAGVGFWGYINRPSARHGLWDYGLPYADGKTPAGAQFKMLTQPQINLADQPEWLKITEEIAGVIVIACTGIGIGLEAGWIGGTVTEEVVAGEITEVTVPEAESGVEDGARTLETNIEYTVPMETWELLVEESEWFGEENLEVDLGEDAIDRLEIPFEDPVDPEPEIPPALQDSFVSLEDILGNQAVEILPDEPSIVELSYEDWDAIDRALFDDAVENDYYLESLEPFDSADWEFAQEKAMGFFDLS